MYNVLTHTNEVILICIITIIYTISYIIARLRSGPPEKRPFPCTDPPNLDETARRCSVLLIRLPTRQAVRRRSREDARSRSSSSSSSSKEAAAAEAAAAEAAAAEAAAAEAAAARAWLPEAPDRQRKIDRMRLRVC